MVRSIRAVAAVVLGLSLGGCKDKSRGDENGGAAPLPAGLSADAFCDQVMGAPMRDIEAKCSGTGDGGARPEEGALIQRQVTSQVNACKQMLTPRVEAARLTLPLATASACSKAIQADPWKDALAVRGVAWYLAHEKACQGVIVGNQGEGAPCQLHIECKPGLSCRTEPGAEDGICAQAPGVNAPCAAPRYPALAAEARGACASGFYCNFETTTERAYARASVKPGASSISPALEGAFLDPEPSAPQTIWGLDQEIGESFDVGGLGLSGIGAGDGGRGEGIGLGTIGTFGHGSGTGDAHGYGSGVSRLRGSPRVAPPEIRVGAISVNGRLPPEVIQRIVRQNFGRFRLCYEQGLRNNPNLQGRVSLRFVIGRDGAVSNVGNGGSDMPDGGVVSCVVRAFYGLSFPQPEGGIVTVTYPVSFSPGDAARGAGTAAPDAGASDAGSANAGASAATRGPAGPRDVCLSLLGDGASCWESWQCADGLQCRNGQCGKGDLVAADGACKEHTDCEAGSFCNGTCKARKKAGEACQASVECQGACSARGVCIALCGSG